MLDAQEVRAGWEQLYAVVALDDLPRLDGVITGGGTMTVNRRSGKG